MKPNFSMISIGRIALLFAALTQLSELRAELTAYERKIIAAVLVLEAADQGEDGMQAVLHVINNRAGGDPDRAIGQVARRKAFSSLNSVTSQKHPDYGPVLRKAMRDRAWPVAMRMVERYAAGVIGDDITRGATHFCIEPPRSWLKQMVFTVKIGAHRFYREG